MDWSDYPNFSKSEFECNETQECLMRPEFLEKLQSLRDWFNKPMIITSGYRSVLHSIEKTKKHPGEHTYGCACDIAVYKKDALLLLNLALDCGFKRIGLNQKGDYNSRFIHLGMGDQLNYPFKEAIWTY